MKKMSKRTQYLIVIFVLLLSIAFGYAFDRNSRLLGQYEAPYSTKDTSLSVHEQRVVSTLVEPVEITKIYHEDKLLGVVSNVSGFDSLLDDVYEQEYQDAFPESQLGYVQDVYMVKELSYNSYENIDNQIFDYIYDLGLLAIEVNKISFSNGAIIYVKNLDDFHNARKEFILGYISESTYDLLANNQRIPDLVTNGTQEIGFDVLETITVTKGMATIDDIYLDETSILNFLSFGYTPNVDSYTVQDFDTLEGIAWLNEMSPNQLLSINKDVISDAQQVLRPGMELNVAKFNSPLTVRVIKQRRATENIYPDSAVYRDDPTLAKGLTRVETEEVIGSEDVLYEDVYENDISVSSTRISATVTVEPVQEVVYVGTYVEPPKASSRPSSGNSSSGVNEPPKVGSGSMSWPMSNARVSCGWYCYGGHTGVDIQSRSNRGYGPIYAADRGTVVLNQWYYGYGYYIVIDHNNGLKTAYGHMEALGYYPVGATVNRGDQIGYVGMTGITTGPHVHFEVMVNGVKVNPCSYIGC